MILYLPFSPITPNLHALLLLHGICINDVPFRISHISLRKKKLHKISLNCAQSLKNDFGHIKFTTLGSGLGFPILCIVCF